ncbi:MAG: branched-chain amino acid ABC transporter substrate-binding protein [Desulfobacterales bacterium S3730MH5]|nr:MAG: branched-chain amino acid ABC transporter substrate-binding protein [Desulfobacterales bacterium S3730MH5]
MGSQLTLHNLVKVFGDVLAVDKVSLNIQHGEFLTLLGPSGSGKTTTLNMIAGFEIPTSGQILLESKDITTVAPNNRGIGMVFQNYALFPHMTVFDNIAFPLKMRKMPGNEIRTLVETTLQLIQLPGFERRYPNQLSGGQQQRIALARALVFRPPILLMDEPLGALDKKLRDHMRLEIKHIQESINITVIYVTHDQEEALTMSDRIAIMNEGRIIQLETPMEIYEFPADLFVADFIGESNFLEGRIGETDGDRMSVEIKQGLKMWIKKQTRLESGKEVTVAIRPEKIQILPDGAEVPVDIINRFSGRVNEVVYVGEASVYDINLAPGLVVGVKVQSGPLARIHKPGDKVVIGWRARHGLALNYDPIGSNSTTKGGTS